MRRRDRHAVVTQFAQQRQATDLHRGQTVGRCVAGITEAEVHSRQCVGCVLIRSDGLVRTGRRVVHRGDAQRQRVRAGTVVRAIGHLEADGGVIPAVGIQCTGVAQLARSDIGSADLLIERYGSPTCAVVLQSAKTLQRADLHPCNLAAFNVAVATEVVQGQKRCRVFQHGHAVIARHRCIVDSGYIKANGVRRLVKVDATVGRATIVFHLEGEVCIASAIGVARRGIDQLAASDVGHTHKRAGRHRRTIQRQRARCRYCGDLDPVQAVTRVVRVAEAEVRRRQNVGAVFRCRDGLVRTGRRIVHRCDRNRYRVGVRQRTTTRVAQVAGDDGQRVAAVVVARRGVGQAG